VQGRRSFHHHIELFVAFSDAVAHLSPESWSRLRRRCADLDSLAFRSLLRRALLAARPYALWLPEGVQPSRTLRVMAGVSRGVQTSIAFAAQVAAEFEASATRVRVSPSTRPTSTGKRGTAAYIDANFRIESALAPLERAHPGVATAVRAAGQGVLRHDWLSRTDFDAVYAYVEPDIPFARLQPPPGESAW
jgi:hypothetical protein